MGLVGDQSLTPPWQRISPPRSPEIDSLTLDELRTLLSATYVPLWKPNATFAAGTWLLAPDGTPYVVATAFTSGATFSTANLTFPAAITAAIQQRAAAMSLVL